VGECGRVGGGGNPWINRVQSALEWCEFPLQVAVLRSQGCAPVLSSSTLHDGGSASDEAAAANAATLQAAAKTQRVDIIHAPAPLASGYVCCQCVSRGAQTLEQSRSCRSPRHVRRLAGPKREKDEHFSLSRNTHTHTHSK
jgi:hypothetical protein